MSPVRRQRYAPELRHYARRPADASAFGVSGPTGELRCARSSCRPCAPAARAGPPGPSPMTRTAPCPAARSAPPAGPLGTPTGLSGHRVGGPVQRYQIETSPLGSPMLDRAPVARGHTALRTAAATLGARTASWQPLSDQQPVSRTAQLGQQPAGPCRPDDDRTRSGPPSALRSDRPTPQYQSAPRPTGTQPPADRWLTREKPMCRAPLRGCQHQVPLPGLRARADRQRVACSSYGPPAGPPPSRLLEHSSRRARSVVNAARRTKRSAAHAADTGACPNSLGWAHPRRAVIVPSHGISVSACRAERPIEPIDRAGGNGAHCPRESFFRFGYGSVRACPGGP